MSFTDILMIIINFAGALAVFLFAMKMMSEGLQKAAGSKMRAILGRITGNPLSGILTGTVVTAVIQSSSATTVMVVSFVNAGLLSLSGAVAVIMGANIGTTATAWIIALLGLGEGSGTFSLPMLLAAISLFFIFSKRESLKPVGETVIGLALLLVGMELLQGAMPNLEQYPGLLEGIASLSGFGFWSILLFIVIGAVLTCLVQSSSAMMAITLLMCYNGMLGTEMAIALVMGQNIGTTITANIAAAVANTAGKRAARAHLVFNVVGVLVTLALFRPIVTLVQSVYPADVPMAITLFHTLFNVGNTVLLAWFIPQILWLVDRMVPEAKEGTGKERKDEYHLTYISGGTVSTAELNLQSAKKELQLFSKEVLKMYALLPGLRTANSEKAFDAILKQISQYEELTDRMDREITDFLTAVGSGGLSQHASIRVSSMLRISDNLESIGDTIFQIAQTRKNKREDAVHFSDHLNANLEQMTAAVQNALAVMDTNLADFDNADLRAANDAENAVNTLRDRLRAEHIEALKTGKYNYAVGNAYSSLYAQYEKLADHVINVSEAIKNDA
jgi:phosphate:Na+ symporter